MQLTFLPEIDREATKKNVEGALEEYKIMLLMEPEEFEPKVTSTFQLVPPSQTNEFYSTTEDTVVNKIDTEIKRKNYINKVRKSINRLSYKERMIIIRRYLSTEHVFDYELYNELGYSESKYYEIKSDAFYKLAFILKIAVYIEEVRHV